MSDMYCMHTTAAVLFICLLTKHDVARKSDLVGTRTWCGFCRSHSHVDHMMISAAGFLIGSSRSLTLRVNASVANSPVFTGGGQYEGILTTSTALAANKIISSHRGQYECILTTSAALAANKIISSHRGQYECILTTSAALAANKIISSHMGGGAV